MKLSQFKSLLKHIMIEAMEAGIQSASGNDLPKRDYNDPRIIAHTIYDSVYLTRFSHKDKDGSDVYEILLHSATGPRHAIKQDKMGKWFYLRDHDKQWISADEYIGVQNQPTSKKSGYTEMIANKNVAPDVMGAVNVGENASISDPDKDEMLRYLQSQYGREEGFNHDAEEAMYWFANFNHGGQSSNLYSVLSTSHFRPGRISRGPEKGSMAEIMLQDLESEFGGKESVLKEDFNYQYLMKAREIATRYFHNNGVKNVELKQYDRRRDISLYKVELNNEEFKYLVKDRENRWYEKVPSETMGEIDKLVPINLGKLDPNVKPPEQQAQQKMPSTHVAKSWTPNAMGQLKMASSNTIKENDYDDEDEPKVNFKDGDKVKLRPEWAGKEAGEVFTLSQWNGRRGWIGDKYGRGWYAMGSQIMKVGDVEEQSVSGGAGAYSTPFAFKKKKTNEKTLPDGRYADDMWDGGRMKRATEMREDTSSGAVFSGGPTIQTPAWGTNNKLGSPKAIKASKSLGLKVVKSITDEE